MSAVITEYVIRYRQIALVYPQVARSSLLVPSLVTFEDIAGTEVLCDINHHPEICTAISDVIILLCTCAGLAPTLISIFNAFRADCYHTVYNTDCALRKSERANPSKGHFPLDLGSLTRRLVSILQQGLLTIEQSEHFVEHMQVRTVMEAGLQVILDLVKEGV
jgi:hypothetical protein